MYDVAGEDVVSYSSSLWNREVIMDHFLMAVDDEVIM